MKSIARFYKPEFDMPDVKILVAEYLLEAIAVPPRIDQGFLLSNKDRILMTSILKLESTRFQSFAGKIRVGNYARTWEEISRTFVKYKTLQVDPNPNGILDLRFQTVFNENELPVGPVDFQSLIECFSHFDQPQGIVLGLENPVNTEIYDGEVCQATATDTIVKVDVIKAVQ